MMVSTSMGSSMAEGFIIFPMEKFSKELGKMEKNMGLVNSKLMERLLKDIGIMVNLRELNNEYSFTLQFSHHIFHTFLSIISLNSTKIEIKFI